MLVISPSTFGASIVAATQIYMDIYDILDGDLQRGVHETCVVLQDLQAAGERFTEYAAGLKPYAKAHMPPNAVRNARATVGLIRPNQERQGVQGWTFHSFSGPKEATFIPLTVLATLPLLAGNKIWLVKYFTHRLGLQFCSAHQTSLAAAYLYQGTGACGILQERWEDMDFVIAHQNSQGRFLRTTDVGLRSVARQYDMALGVSLQELARVERPRLPAHNICANKSVKLQSTSIFIKAFCANGGSRRGITGRQHDGMDTMYECVRQAASAEGGLKDPMVAAQWATAKELASTQLLQVLQDSLSADEPHLNFDYFSFFARCLDLLGKTSDVYCDRQLSTPKLYKLAVDACMYEVVDAVLWEAVAHESRGLDPSQMLLHHVSQALQAVIVSTGDDCVMRCLLTSSGHIP